MADTTTLTPTPDSYFTFTLLSNDTYEIKAKDKNNMPAEVAIPSTYNGKAVTSIGDFNNCTSLTSIAIPDSVTKIGGSAFYYCSGLTSITIGNSVTSIGKRAFGYCGSLANIIVAEGNTKYHSAGNCIIETASKTLIAGCKASVIPTDGSVTSIGEYAFAFCSKLTSITIPNSVTSIGNSAFNDCSKLTSITIPDSVTSIGQSAFSSCKSLTSITIPNSVTSIGEYAFYYSTNLTSITCQAITPPAIQSNTFRDVPATCLIYVPAVSVETYKAATNWSTRKDYIQAMPVPTPQYLDEAGLKQFTTKIKQYVDNHIENKANPHGVTKAQVDLGNVDNVKQIPNSEKGANGGVATLDAQGKVPAAQLPSYVDDVLEYANKAVFPATGESGKIYVDLSDGKTYRWGGTAYAEISSSLALGETDSTAYAGSKGKKNAEDIATLKTAADKAQTTADNAKSAAETNAGNITKITDGTTKVGKAGAADKLATARKISLDGDATGEVNFDGSADKKITVTLADSGVTAGSYSAVTVDSKGRVTVGAKIIEIEEQGQTTPTANLATGGLFFKQLGKENNVLSGYTLQRKTDSGAMVEVPLAATYDSAGNKITDAYETKTDASTHKNSASNPHGVTKAQVGLGNVDNTSDASKPVSTAQQNALNLKEDKSNLKALAYKDKLGKADVGLENVDNVKQIPNSEKGVAGGVATLGTDGKVLSTQLPEYKEPESIPVETVNALANEIFGV